MQACLKFPFLSISIFKKIDHKATYEIENLSRLDEHVERLHYLLDTSVIVPPVDVQKVDVRSAQFFKGGLH